MTNATAQATARDCEIWRPIAEFEGNYSVSSFGRVRRDARGQRTQVGRILKPRPETHGYLSVQLSLKGQERSYRISSLVALSFLGPRPDGHEVNHKDGNKTNNHITNLEWATRSENMRHAYRLGLRQKTPPIQPRRLSEADVVAIRRLTGSTASIARRYKVNRGTIARIRNGSGWRHVA